MMPLRITTLDKLTLSTMTLTISTLSITTLNDVILKCDSFRQLIQKEHAEEREKIILLQSILLLRKMLMH